MGKKNTDQEPNENDKKDQQREVGQKSYSLVKRVKVQDPLGKDNIVREKRTCSEQKVKMHRQRIKRLQKKPQIETHPQLKQDTQIKDSQSQEEDLIEDGSVENEDLVIQAMNSMEWILFQLEVPPQTHSLGIILEQSGGDTKDQ